MLVKFLSFVASVLGTARYKALFLSCLALVLAITGITAVALFKSDNQAPIAASTVDKQENDKKSQGNTPELSGVQSQTTKNPSQTDLQANTKDKPPTDSGANPTTDTKTKTTIPEIVVASDKVTIAAGSTSDSLTASLSNKGSAAWSIAPVNSGDNGVKATLSQNNGSTISFQLQANSNLQTGTIIHLNLIAQDTERNNITKQITVTIQ